MSVCVCVCVCVCVSCDHLSSCQDSSDVVATAAMKRADSHRMSLPSHFHPRDRQSVTPDSFLPPSHTAVTATATGPRPHSQLNRHLSQSSGIVLALLIAL